MEDRAVDGGGNEAIPVVVGALRKLDRGVWLDRIGSDPRLGPSGRIPPGMRQIANHADRT